MKKSNWKKEFRQKFGKDYTIKSDPHDYTHEGLDLNQHLGTAISFILDLLEKQKKELNVDMLRQWLNEDRITDPKKIVTNKDIKDWLKLNN